MSNNSDEKNPVANALYALARAFRDPNATEGRGINGGYVDCMIEALMDHTAAIVKVSEALQPLDNIEELIDTLKEGIETANERLQFIAESMPSFVRVKIQNE